MKNKLVQEIKQKLNISGGMFIDSEIESYVNEIPENKYIEFFKALSGGEYEYKNAMDRIAMTAKRFKNEKTDNLLAGTREKAKAMYDKFYDESCMMFKHTYDNRDKYPSDAEFFDNVQYKNLKKIDGTSVYTEQEIYVLDELGGGKWLIGIRLALSSKDIIDKIEQVIKDAVMKKYSNQPAISYEVKKMLPK
ncbi:MAG: hypothetical protein WCX83_00300 [Candidatus Cloacimonas sp.]